jgi:hypothetical protein
MATLREKIAAEQDVRAMLEDHGLPQPDEVQYGQTCIRLLWHEEKTVVVVDIDEPEESLFDQGPSELVDDEDEAA